LKTINLKSISFILTIYTSILFGQYNFDINQLIEESEKFIQQPINWELSDWGKLGLTTATTFILIHYDDVIRNEIKKLNFNRKSIPIEFGRILGEIYTTVLISGAFAITGFSSENYKHKKIAYEILQSAFYAGIIATSLKFIFGRARPYNELGKVSFQSLNRFSDDYWSFPSVHATLAFSLSTVLSDHVESDLLKLLVFTPAFLTAYSRVAQDYHWTSDVVLGAAIGYFVGKWVTSNHNENNPKISFQGDKLFLSIPLK
jgi:membrane-associated phospholipid phosphatase